MLNTCIYHETKITKAITVNMYFVILGINVEHC